MSTNRKFKKGDRVVAMNADTGFCHHKLTVGQLHEVTDINAGGFLFLDGVKGKSYAPDRFMSERDYVEMCIKALCERNIRIAKSGASMEGFEYYTSGVSRMRLKEFLDKLYPIVPEETAEQKQLRELEEKQREIADAMKALREKINESGEK